MVLDVSPLPREGSIPLLPAARRQKANDEWRWQAIWNAMRDLCFLRRSLPPSSMVRSAALAALTGPLSPSYPRGATEV
jgi:hypothetical protein